MAEVNILTAQRANIKGRMTRIYNFAKSAENSDDINELEVRNSELDALFEKFNNIQDQIESLDISPERQSIHETERQLLEDRYYNIKALLRSILKASDSKPRVSREHFQIKLPQLNIPTFSGKYTDWANFKNLFYSIIHRNALISPLQKFHYLKSLLSDEPAGLINSLLLNEDNYANALNLLEKRYENKLIIVNNHLKSIFNGTTVNKANLKQFLVEFQQNLDSLKSLSIPIETWDLMLIYIITQKLEISLRSAWELSRQTTELPTLQQLLDFLNHRCVALELIHDSPTSCKIQNKIQHKVNHFTTQVNSVKCKCILCNKESHELYKCPSYLELSVEERNKFVMAKKLCYNCLNLYKPNHKCSRSTCRLCNKKHHTTLHKTQSINTNIHNNMPLVCNKEENKQYDNDQLSIPSPSAVLTINTNFQQVLLATALVKIKNNTGSWCTARALLDSGSEINLITKELAVKLGTTLRPNSIKIQGIGNSTHHSYESACINVKSRLNNFQFNLTCSVTDHITSPLPHWNVDTTRWNIPTKCKLADPSFHTPGNIDILIGAQWFCHIFRQGYVKIGTNLPMLSNTVFGWIVSGEINDDPVTLINYKATAHSTSLFLSRDNELTRFWKQEELPCKPFLSLEDKYCEELYNQTTTRDETGRYTVNLPLKNNSIHLLGNSFNTAYKCLRSLESKFKTNSSLHSDYTDFIHEYIKLGHAQYIPLNQIQTTKHIYYLPHHAVIKPDSVSTKLRVVFNGSAKTSTGVSLNDILLEGPNILPQLIDIMIRFRTYPYVFTADIVKMFRQININPDQRFLQCILWRDSHSKPIQVLQLNTVTYGTKSAPYLAYRTLQQLARDNGHLYPLASHCIQTQFYMDDVLTGGYSIEQTIKLRIQLEQLLHKAGLKLHKWATNNINILNKSHNSESKNVSSTKYFELQAEQNLTKTLGIQWEPATDNFKFCIQPNKLTVFSKRTVLSCISQIFDPIGYLSPVIIIGKIFIQTLWKENLQWDEPISEKLIQKWKSFYDNLHHLKQIEIPRYCFNSLQPDSVQLIGFCDASQLAYGACVYIRTVHEDTISCNILASKSRVAPIKIVTIPRLELNSALLLTRLINKLTDILSLNVQVSATYLFTDSSIVLHWLKNPSKKLNIYITNRVSEILEHTSYNQWRHIPTRDNPADYITRGLNPQQLKDTHAWWHGPSWITLPTGTWPLSKIPHSTNEHLEKESLPKVVSTTRNVNENENYFINIFNKISNFSKLIRIIAFCYRFIHNLKSKSKLTHPLTVKELTFSHDFVIKCIQLQEFSIEINELQSKKLGHNSVTLKSSPLKKLVPFLDSKGLLRVGGRIKHANVSYSQKHPIILPSKQHVTQLIIRQYHINLFHSGPQNVLTNIRLKYWPINGRNLVKKVIHSCVICTRFRGKAYEQLMADLPADRVNLQRPFLNVGIDFGGPIYIKSSRQRNSKLTKGYICLFVCMATRAIHLELVSDLTTDGFIGALKRFISRRGYCQSIYSDNATNFKGAHNELKQLHLMFLNQYKHNEILNFTANNNINWHFTVPTASHMGGIYEAGIKSVKNLLKKKLMNARLTFEDLNTILIQIEAILNSRPLFPATDLPDDLACITPSHFLIGQSLMGLPEPDLQNLPEGRLSLHQKITAIKQQFWKQWHKQYLSELQCRNKWNNVCNNISVGNLVLIKEDSVPPLHWILGRVIELFKNSTDGLVRSARVKTATGNYHRPIHKLVHLPVPPCTST